MRQPAAGLQRVAEGSRYSERAWARLRLFVVVEHEAEAVAAWSGDKFRSDRQWLEHDMDRSGRRHRVCVALASRQGHGRDDPADTCVGD